MITERKKTYKRVLYSSSESSFSINEVTDSRIEEANDSDSNKEKMDI